MSDLSEDENSTEDDTKIQFHKAAEYIQKIHKELPASDLLEFYGLYKQSTCGECNTPKPGIFNPQGRAKWEAWNNLGKLDQSKAMELYFKKLQTLKPNWNYKKDAGKKSQWVCTSVHVKEVEEDIPEDSKTIFDFVKENNVEKLKIVLTKENVNDKDSDGIGLIHWATDRNASEVLEYLISLGADVNLQDSDFQTALHYAATCGHMKCIKILLDNGADMSILNEDGQSFIDVAFDETIKSFLLNN